MTHNHLYNAGTCFCSACGLHLVVPGTMVAPNPIEQPPLLFVSGVEVPPYSHDHKSRFGSSLAQTRQQRTEQRKRALGFRNQSMMQSVVVSSEISKDIPRYNIPNMAEICRLPFHGVPISYIVILKDHAVPKTTSGKLRRVLTKEWCLNDQWKPTTVLDLMTQDPTEPVPPSQQQVSNASTASLDKSQHGARPNFSENQSSTKTMSDDRANDQLTPPRHGPAQSTEAPSRPTHLSTHPGQDLLDQTISSMSEAFRQASGRDIPIDEPFAISECCPWRLHSYT